MSETLNARRTRLSLSINGVDVGADLAPYLKNFSFKDNAKGKADEIRFSLMDRDGRFQKEWFIQKGCAITAQLTCLDWYKPGENIALPMGEFTVDEVELSGPPDLIRVKAVSAAKTSALSEEARTRGWETCTLQGIADEIAQRHGYELMYDAPEIPFERIEQREASDLAFLHKTSSKYGVNLKVHDNKMILYGADAWDAKGPRFVIPKKGSPLSPSSWSFKKGSQGTGKKAEIAYHDPAKGETITAGVAAPGAAPSGQTLTLNQRVENESQAIALGQGALRAANEGEHTADLDFMGLPGLVAGITVCLEGWGEYDGGYFVEAAEHKLSPAYSTSAELRKTLAPGTVREESPLDSDPWFSTAISDAGLPPEPYHEDLILCLGDMAADQAERADSIDRQGWLYLSLFVRKWLSKKAYTIKDAKDNGGKEDNGGQDPSWMECAWLKNYPRYNRAEKALLQPEYLFSPKARAKLVSILRDEGAFSGNGEPFDHITLKGKYTWDKLRGHAFQGKEMDYRLVEALDEQGFPDGLQAAVANATIYAVAAGTTKKLENGTWKVHVQRVAAFIYDDFGFNNFQWLGNWWCSEEYKGYRHFGLPLWNHNFRDFRQNSGRGCDFRIMCLPHPLAEFKGYSYDTV